MLFLIHSIDNPVLSKKIRPALLDDHLAWLDKHKHLIVIGGALVADDGQTRVGSSIIVNASGREIVEAFSENEPYRKAGLYQTVTITRMRRGQWSPENAPDSIDGN